MYGSSNKGGEDKDGKEGSGVPGEWESGDCLASCMQMTWFLVVRRSKIMVLSEEEGLECEVPVDEIRLESLGYVLDESSTDGIGHSRKVASGRRVAGAIRSLVNVRDLEPECGKVMHETLLVPVLMYGSETM